MSADKRQAVLHIGVDDLRASLIEITDKVTIEIVRRNDLETHQRLQQCRASCSQRFLKRFARRDTERHIVRFFGNLSRQQSNAYPSQWKTPNRAATITAPLNLIDQRLGDFRCQRSRRNHVENLNARFDLIIRLHSQLQFCE